MTERSVVLTHRPSDRAGLPAPLLDDELFAPPAIFGALALDQPASSRCQSRPSTAGLGSRASGPAAPAAPTCRGGVEQRPASVVAEEGLGRRAAGARAGRVPAPGPPGVSEPPLPPPERALQAASRSRRASPRFAAGPARTARVRWATSAAEPCLSRRSWLDRPRRREDQVLLAAAVAVRRHPSPRSSAVSVEAGRRLRASTLSA